MYRNKKYADPKEPKWKTWDQMINFQCHLNFSHKKYVSIDILPYNTAVVMGDLTTIFWRAKHHPVAEDPDVPCGCTPTSLEGDCPFLCCLWQHPDPARSLPPPLMELYKLLEDGFRAADGRGARPICSRFKSLWSYFGRAVGAPRSSHTDSVSPHFLWPHTLKTKE